MKKDKRFWYLKAGGLYHAIYPAAKGYGLLTLCQLKIKDPFTNIVQAVDGVWKETTSRCGNCRRFLKI